MKSRQKGKLLFMFEHITLSIALLLGTVLVGGCGSTRPRTPLSYQELRGYGTEFQTHQYSCGAAAMATLMNTFGESVTEVELLAEVFEDDPKLRIIEQEGEDDELYLDPLTVKNLEDLARARGFKVLSLQAMPESAAAEALESLHPVITRLNLYGDTLHFVLVRDIRNGFVNVSDPGYGNYRIPLRQFYEAWEAGDRILVAISRKPFLVWQEEETGQLYVKRDPEEVIAGGDPRFPGNLYEAARRTITLVNTTLR